MSCIESSRSTPNNTNLWLLRTISSRIEAAIVQWSGQIPKLLPLVHIKVVAHKLCIQPQTYYKNYAQNIDSSKF